MPVIVHSSVYTIHTSVSGFTMFAVTTVLCNNIASKIVSNWE